MADTLFFYFSGLYFESSNTLLLSAFDAGIEIDNDLFRSRSF